MHSVCPIPARRLIATVKRDGLKDETVLIGRKSLSFIHFPKALLVWLLIGLSQRKPIPWIIFVCLLATLFLFLHRGKLWVWLSSQRKCKLWLRKIVLNTSKRSIFNEKILFYTICKTAQRESNFVATFTPFDWLLLDLWGSTAAHETIEVNCRAFSWKAVNKHKT